jgi:Tfp pilus assembly protein PilP
MGQNRGVVKKITKDSLIVEEKFKNYMGVTERKEITITLHKKQEGMP